MQSPPSLVTDRAAAGATVRGDGAEGPAVDGAPFVDDTAAVTRAAVARAAVDRAAVEKAAVDRAAVHGAVDGVGNCTEGKESVEMDMTSVRREIAPLSKEQLIELLAAAALKHSDVYQSCLNTVKESPASRRLMIRNIAFSSKNEDFVKLFSQFGEIDDAAIVRDRDNKSKGYGFVTFQSSQGVEQCFQSKELTLDGRQLLVKLAGDPYADFSSGGELVAKTQETSRRKLFIRNLADRTDSEALRKLFGEYGAIEECVVVCNSEGRSRGYGFVTYSSADSAVKAVQQPQRVIDGKVAFVAFATPTRTKHVGPTVRPTDHRRNLREQPINTTGYPIVSPGLSSAANLVANLYNPYNPTGYPAVMPFYDQISPTASHNYGPPAINMPVSSYDYINTSAVAMSPHRYI